GLPPFSAAKSRKDIPDAFIYAVLLDLAGELGGVAFASSDRRFLEACRGASGVAVFDSIQAFLAIGAIRSRRVSVDDGRRRISARTLLIRSEAVVRSHSESSINLFLMTNPTVFPEPADPEISG